MRGKIVAVSATTASLLSPDLIKQVISEGSEKTPAFRRLVSELREARNANRSEKWYVLSLYLMTGSTEDKDKMAYVADAEENPASRAHLGEIDTEGFNYDINEHINAPYSPPYFLTDKWGTWMSGFAPVFDEEGEYVATVGADVSIDEVKERLHTILLYGLSGLLASVGMALILAQVLARRLSRSLEALHLNVKLSEEALDSTVDLEGQDEFVELDRTMSEMLKGLKERDTIKTSYARYVSKHVLDTIVKTDAPMPIEGEKRKITILFTDIRQFKSLTEKFPHEKLVSFFNEYFEMMIHTIFKYSGTLDTFLGDSLMAKFGSPTEDANQELHATKAAVEMQQNLRDLCQKWKSQGIPKMQIGIGIHTGYATICNIGSEKKMEYTACSDTANVALSLEQLTDALNEDIIISQTTYDAVKDIFECKEVDPMAIPGRSEEMKAYTVSAARAFHPIEK